MINVISRPPNDTFTFELFEQLTSSLDCDYEAHYLWSNPPKRLKRFLETTKFSKPNVVIGIKDLLDQWVSYNPWHGANQIGIQLIDEMAARNPERNFVIFTSLENISAEKLSSPNIQFVCWGGDITNQASLYPTVQPVLNKNFESEAPYICLNRNCREHRVVTLSYLLGRGYSEFGYLTFLGNKLIREDGDQNILDVLPWDFDSIQADFFVDNREVIKQGYIKFCNTDLKEDVYEIYEQPNDNVTNFNSNLRRGYRHSFVEIVSESSFSTPAYNVTEKTLNCFYACNFPIVLGGVGIVQLLRDIGFDMFDDIINHEYDKIDNPFNRIINAIECNKRLLTDPDYTKNIWRANQARFEDNVNTARTKLYDWYRDRTHQEFARLHWI